MSKKKIQKVDTETGEIIEERVHPELRKVVRTHSTYMLGQFPGDMEHPSGVKLTTPGMAVTLDELINRFVAGRPVPRQGDPYFLGDLPDPKDMDKDDAYLYGQQVRKTIADNEAIIEASLSEGRKNGLERLRTRNKELSEKIESLETKKS